MPQGRSRSYDPPRAGGFGAQSWIRTARYMSNLGASVGWGLLVGASLLLGALVAVGRELPERIAAVVTSFGGGILVAAVAFELVPEADAEAGVWVTPISLLAGALVYVGADAWLTRDPRMEAMRRVGDAAAAGGAERMRPGPPQGAGGG